MWLCFVFRVLFACVFVWFVCLFLFCFLCEAYLGIKTLYSAYYTPSSDACFETSDRNVNLKNRSQDPHKIKGLPQNFQTCLIKDILKKKPDLQGPSPIIIL